MSPSRPPVPADGAAGHAEAIARPGVDVRAFVEANSYFGLRAGGDGPVFFDNRPVSSPILFFSAPCVVSMF